MRALVRAMVGREVKPLEVRIAEARLPAEAPAEAHRGGFALVSTVWRCRTRAGRGRGSTFSLAVRRGEIVGLAGVEGNGQSQLGVVLAGLLPPTAGRVVVGGDRRRPARPPRR